MANPALLAKAAATVLSDERTRKAAGWVVVAVLSPLILLVAFFCALGSGTSEHNISAVELCFNGGALPANVPAEYRACIEEMQSRLEFSGLNIMDGWKTYSMEDVSAAAYHAFRKESLPAERRLEILLHRLDGKEITWADRPTEGLSMGPSM